jgi:hypothetical protein
VHKEIVCIRQVLKTASLDFHGTELN